MLATSVPHASYFHASYAANKWGVADYLFRLDNQGANGKDDVVGDIFVNGDILLAGTGEPGTPMVDGVLKATGDIRGMINGIEVIEGADPGIETSFR